MKPARRSNSTPASRLSRRAVRSSVSTICLIPHHCSKSTFALTPARGEPLEVPGSGQNRCAVCAGPGSWVVANYTWGPTPQQHVLPGPARVRRSVMFSVAFAP
eukprot:scaffold81130_cov60-Phaeocystis_antarctica.AAC.4